MEIIINKIDYSQISFTAISLQVYKSALCQGHGLSALNLPSCRCRVKGQMSLEGFYWGVGGGGVSLQHSGFVTQLRVFKGSV